MFQKRESLQADRDKALNETRGMALFSWWFLLVIHLLGTSTIALLYSEIALEEKVSNLFFWTFYPAQIGIPALILLFWPKLLNGAGFKKYSKPVIAFWLRYTLALCSAALTVAITFNKIDRVDSIILCVYLLIVSLVTYPQQKTACPVE